MGNLLNPNYLNIPEQVERNTRKLEGSKIFRTTLNLTSGTSSIPIETTNIDDIKKVFEDSVIFSANGLMFLIKAFTKNSVLVEFYSDLSSVNYLLTQFNFETEDIIYQNDSAEFKGEIKYDDDELTGEKIVPANIKLKIKGGNQITIDVDESGKILIIKIDEDFLSQIEETIELSSENAQQLQRCLKTPISPPSSPEFVGIGENNSQILINVKRYVIETYISSNGLTRYTIYNDGWKECSGFVINNNSLSNTGEITIPVALPIEFSDNKYSIMVSNTWQSSGDYGVFAGSDNVNDKTKNSFKLSFRNNSGGSVAQSAAFWEVKGY